MSRELGVGVYPGGKVLTEPGIMQVKAVGRPTGICQVRQMVMLIATTVLIQMVMQVATTVLMICQMSRQLVDLGVESGFRPQWLDGGGWG